jgi:hypothetical protein
MLIFLIAAMLRLGTECDIKYLLKEVVAFLSVEFPSTLVVWDEHNTFRIRSYDGQLTL